MKTLVPLAAALSSISIPWVLAACSDPGAPSVAGTDSSASMSATAERSAGVPAAPAATSPIAPPLASEGLSPESSPNQSSGTGLPANAPPPEAQGGSPSVPPPTPSTDSNGGALQPPAAAGAGAMESEGEPMMVAPAAHAGNSGSGNGATSGPPPTFETVKEVLNFGCFGAQCHDLEEHSLFLKGNDQELLVTLRSYVVAKCEGAQLVDREQPAQSALVRILSGSCGQLDRMPPTCLAGEVAEDNPSCIPDDYIAAIEQWIADGAQP